MKTTEILQDIVDAFQRKYDRIANSGIGSDAEDLDNALIALRQAQLPLVNNKDLVERIITIANSISLSDIKDKLLKIAEEI